METALNENMKDVDALYRSLLRKLRRYDSSLFTKTTAQSTVLNVIDGGEVNTDDDLSIQVKTATTIEQVKKAFTDLLDANTYTVDEKNLMYKGIRTIARSFNTNYNSLNKAKDQAIASMSIIITTVTVALILIAGYNYKNGNFEWLKQNWPNYTSAKITGSIGALILFYIYMANNIKSINDDKLHGRYLYKKLSSECNLDALKDDISKDINASQKIANFMVHYCNNFVLNPRDSVALTARIKVFFDRQKLFLNKRFQSMTYKSDVDKRVNKLFNVFVQENSSVLVDYIKKYANTPEPVSAPAPAPASALSPAPAPVDAASTIANLTAKMQDVCNTILKKTVRQNTLITLQQNDGGNTYSFMSYMIKDILGSTFSGLDGNTLFQALQRVAQHQANTASAKNSAINADILADPNRAITNINMIVTYIEDDVKNQRIIAEPDGTPSVPTQFVDLNLFNQMMADTSIAQLQKMYNEMRVIDGVMNGELSQAQLEYKLEYNAAAYQGGYTNIQWAAYGITLVVGGCALGGFVLDEEWLGAKPGTTAAPPSTSLSRPKTKADVETAIKAAKDALDSAEAQKTRDAAIEAILAYDTPNKSQELIDMFLNAEGLTSDERQKRKDALDKKTASASRTTNKTSLDNMDATLKLVIVICTYIFIGIMGFGLISRRQNDLTYAYTARDDNSTGLINGMTELMSMIQDLQALKRLHGNNDPTDKQLDQVEEYVHISTTNGAKTYVSSSDNTLEFKNLPDAIAYSTEQKVHDIYYQYINTINLYDSDNYFRPELIQVPFPWTEILMNFVMLVICIMVLTIAFTNFSPYKNAERISTASKCIDRAEVIKGETMAKRMQTGGAAAEVDPVLKNDLYKFYQDADKLSIEVEGSYTSFKDLANKQNLSDEKADVIVQVSLIKSDYDRANSKVTKAQSDLDAKTTTMVHRETELNTAQTLQNNIAYALSQYNNAKQEVATAQSVLDAETATLKEIQINKQKMEQRLNNATTSRDSLFPDLLYPSPSPGSPPGSPVNSVTITSSLNETVDASKIRLDKLIGYKQKLTTISNALEDQVVPIKNRLNRYNKEVDDLYKSIKTIDENISKLNSSNNNRRYDEYRNDSTSETKNQISEHNINKQIANQKINDFKKIIVETGNQLDTVNSIAKRFNNNMISAFGPKIDALIKKGSALIAAHKDKFDNEAKKQQIAQLDGKCVIMDEQVDDSAQQQVIKVSIMVAVISSTLYMSNVILNSSMGYGSTLQQMRHI